MLASDAATLRSGNDFWFVAGPRLLELAPKTPESPAAALLSAGALKSIQGISVAARLTDAANISLRLLSSTAEDAEAMAGGFVMLAGMLKSDKKRAAQFGPLVDAMKVRAEGKAAILDVSLTPAQIAALGAQIGSMVQAQAPKPKPESKPAPKPPQGVVIHSSPSDMGTVTLPPPK
jgi:hypothetical protein